MDALEKWPVTDSGEWQGRRFAEAILTTDTCTKTCVVTEEFGSGSVTSRGGDRAWFIRIWRPCWPYHL